MDEEDTVALPLTEAVPVADVVPDTVVDTVTVTETERVVVGDAELDILTVKVGETVADSLMVLVSLEE